MKIAIQLFGHLRDFEECALSLNKYLLDKHECDVFIHTWDITDHNTKSFHNRKTDLKQVDEKVLSKINNLYKPKKVKIENQKKYNNIELNYLYNSNLSFSTATLYFMFYSMNYANELRKNYEKEKNITYDLIVVTRPDIELKKEIEFSKIIEQTKILNLDTNKCRFFATKPGESSGVPQLYINQPNDLLFFGSSFVIDKYIQCNLNIDVEYAKKHAINVVSIYTSNEIKNNVIPIPIAYNLGEDWTFMGYRIKDKINYKKWSKIKIILAYIFCYIVYPVKKIYNIIKRRYPWAIQDN